MGSDVGQSRVCGCVWKMSEWMNGSASVNM